VMKLLNQVEGELAASMKRETPAALIRDLVFDFPNIHPEQLFADQRELQCREFALRIQVYKFDFSVTCSNKTPQTCLGL
jgi:hypothetical protein